MNNTAAPLRKRGGASIRRCDRCGGSEPAPRSNQLSTHTSRRTISKTLARTAARGAENEGMTIVVGCSRVICRRFAAVSSR